MTSGCLQGDDNGGGGGGSGLGSSDGDGVVEILGAFGGQEEEAFLESLAAFEEESGIDVKYTADSDFSTTIPTRVNAGDAPDIALFPQPGGLVELAEDGFLTPLGDAIDLGAIESTLIPGFLDATELDGEVYGAPMRMAVKSLVWYPKPEYADKGYNTDPQSFQELQETAEQIMKDGTAPWCIGWESDQDTGWVGTDWLEEMVLRTAGPDVYDQWVNHEIPFDDPAIVEALDAAGEVMKTDGMVLGDERAILNTGFADAMQPAFAQPPRCYLHRQGNFATGFYPEDVQKNLDDEVGVFVLPPVEGGFDGQPILGGGDLAALFNGDDDEAIEVMEFLTSDQFGVEWAAAGGWLSPHATFDASNYSDETTREIAAIASEADVFRFDASDLMPPVIGSDVFWDEMVEWIDGKSTEETLAAIEEEWPE
ncbi:ABC transporter substrate-binding protein [Nocardioides sp. GCM10027113]|uniref:ABC transporter substrate-binding protein n=1 Tax=unclassified Nocardioides TaxID=2615069 RepID=UPI00360CB533